VATKKNTPVRPGRQIVMMLVLLLGGLATMYGTNTTTPKLAIDLAGGTSVTLTALPLPEDEGGKGGKITPENMKQAVKIIRARVNGFGVSEAQVTTLGNDNIVVAVPGQNDNTIVQKVGQTALLRFRPVLRQGVIDAVTGQDLPSDTGLGNPDDSATASPSPKPGDKASPSPSAKASPKKSDSPRPVSDALRAADSPTPSPSASASPAAEEPPVEEEPEAATTITPAIEKEYRELQCSQAKLAGGDQNPADAVVVACDRNFQAKYILGPSAVQGTEVTSANAALPSGASVGAWKIDMQFDGKGTDAFAKMTRLLAVKTSPQNQLAITLDGVVQSAPSVSDEIPNGIAEITGSFTQTEAEDLANVLKYGALPLAFERSKIDTVSATLGSDQLTGGLIAGAIGIIGVVLYCIGYYRGLGIIALFGLMAAAALSYMSVTLLGHDKALSYRLSLAGVAGLIVAIGITADSFVVYFERLRDEIRDGRTPRSAAEYGWVRARRTIITANSVSLLAAAVLYFFSVADVKGFAFTLGMATIIDVVVIFLLTKPMVTLAMKSKFFADGAKLSGVNRANLGVYNAPVTVGRPASPKGA
jgi:preprotein translocase subunit SecD